jgi:hypothetical protein
LVKRKPLERPRHTLNGKKYTKNEGISYVYIPLHASIYKEKTGKHELQILKRVPLKFVSFFTG